jgi:hypothetical protein
VTEVVPAAELIDSAVKMAAKMASFSKPIGIVLFTFSVFSRFTSVIRLVYVLVG